MYSLIIDEVLMNQSGTYPIANYAHESLNLDIATVKAGLYCYGDSNPPKCTIGDSFQSVTLNRRHSIYIIL